MAHNYSNASLVPLWLVKDILDETGTSNDKQLLRQCDAASTLAETLCRRKFRRKRYTEYKSGDGEVRTIYLDNYPVDSDWIEEVNDDTAQSWGTGTSVSSDLFTLYPEEGMIELLGATASGLMSRFAEGARNIKVVYTGGFSNYRIFYDMNDVIDFEESTGTALTATISPGEYDQTTYCSAVKTALDAAGSSTYTVSNSDITQKITIASAGGGGRCFRLLWDSGDNVGSDPGELTGFTNGTDLWGALSYTAQSPSGWCPSDLEYAIAEVTAGLWLQSEAGDKRLGIRQTVYGSENVTRLFEEGFITKNAMSTLMLYKKHNVFGVSF